MTRFRWDKPRRTEGEVSWRVQNLSLFGKSSIKKSIFSKLTIWEWNISISIDIYGCDDGCMDGVWGSEHARTLLLRSFWAYLTEIWSLSPRYICSLFNIFARLRFRDHHPTYFGTGKCPFLLSVPARVKSQQCDSNNWHSRTGTSESDWLHDKVFVSAFPHKTLTRCILLPSAGFPDPKLESTLPLKSNLRHKV